MMWQRQPEQGSYRDALLLVHIIMSMDGHNSAHHNVYTGSGVILG